MHTLMDSGPEDLVGKRRFSPPSKQLMCRTKEWQWQGLSMRNIDRI